MEVRYGTADDPARALFILFFLAFIASIRYAQRFIYEGPYTSNTDGVVRYFVDNGCGDALQISYEVCRGDLRRAEALLADLSSRGVIRPVDTAAKGDHRQYEFPPYELAA